MNYLTLDKAAPVRKAWFKQHWHPGFTPQQLLALAKRAVAEDVYPNTVTAKVAFKNFRL